MIGPLLRVVASAAAARSLRNTVDEAITRALLIVGAAAAVVVASICLSLSAFAVLEPTLDTATAWAIVGAFWGVLGLGYFVATTRRRRRS